jgi:hypothetical protein
MSYRLSTAIQKLLAVAIMIAALSPAMAQSFSPFNEFKNMSLAELATVQMKLTFIGEQEEPISTVVITAPSTQLNMALFVPFRRPGYSYANDNLGIRRITASTSELQGILQNAGNIGGVSSGAVQTPPIVSFAMVANVSGTIKGFEAILNPTDGAALLKAIQNALQGNPQGLAIIADFACTSGLHDTDVPADVSSSVSVTLGGLRLNRTPGRFVSTAMLENNGSTAVAAPVSLVLALPSGVFLFNANGMTCSLSPIGRSFINAPLTAPLPAGGSVQINLEFQNPESVPVTPATSVFAGPGSR